MNSSSQETATANAAMGDHSPTPWTREPDVFDWKDDATGYACAMRRGPGGHWCADVGIPKEHPWHGYDYSKPVIATPEMLAREVSMDDLGVIEMFCGSIDSNPSEGIYRVGLLIRTHGGVTFAGRAWWDKEDPRWWFGFDCAHSGDLCPKYESYRGIPSSSDVYRTAEYVRERVTRMAGDLALACQPTSSEAAQTATPDGSEPKNNQHPTERTV